MRKVTVSTGVITTIAGTGSSTYGGDNGAATSASLVFPAGVAVDSSGNIFIAEYSSHRIRKVTVSTGIITTVAGTGTASYSGDNGPATSATLQNPHSIDIDSFGNLCIADRYNHRVRKLTVSTGVMTTVAGTGTASSTGDGAAATSAAVNAPVYCRFDSADNLYITEYNDNGAGNRVRKVFTVTTGIPTAAPSYAPTYTPTDAPTSDIVVYSTGTIYGSSSMSKSSTDALFNGIFYRKCSTSGSSPCGSEHALIYYCLLYTSPSPRDRTRSRMPSSA